MYRLKRLRTQKVFLAIPSFERLSSRLCLCPSLIRRNHGQVVRFCRGKTSLRLVRGVAIILRREEQRSTAHRSGDRENRIETAQQRAKQKHFTYTSVDRHLRQVTSERRQTFIGVECSQRAKLVKCGVNCASIRRCQSGAERLRDWLFAHSLDGQTQLLKRRSKHFGRLLRQHVRELRSRKHCEPRARRRATRTTSPLLRRRLRDPSVCKH
mmetsp:Transcript_8556/g.33917  ORF Transcript_8556/g.33917 Transcript_8556/m.33917 type:complete len:211 (+) Transcript_8556:717-1349(+)